MPTAPIDRKTQIELMTTAEQRHHALAKTWSQNPAFRAAVRLSQSDLANAAEAESVVLRVADR